MWRRMRRRTSETATVLFVDLQPHSVADGSHVKNRPSRENCGVCIHLLFPACLSQRFESSNHHTLLCIKIDRLGVAQRHNR